MIEKRDDSDFRKLKLYVARLQTVVNELAALEDGEADYSKIESDLRFITGILEQRRELLQRRGRTQ